MPVTIRRLGPGNGYRKNKKTVLPGAKNYECSIHGFLGPLIVAHHVTALGQPQIGIAAILVIIKIQAADGVVRITVWPPAGPQFEDNSGRRQGVEDIAAGSEGQNMAAVPEGVKK